MCPFGIPFQVIIIHNLFGPVSYAAAKAGEKCVELLTAQNAMLTEQKTKIDQIHCWIFEGKDTTKNGDSMTPTPGPPSSPGTGEVDTFYTRERFTKCGADVLTRAQNVSEQVEG